MADTKCGSQFVERDDSRVAAASLQPTDVLLAEAGKRAEFLLGQSFRKPDPFEIFPYQLAHIHADIVQEVCTLMLPTIICKAHGIVRGKWHEAIQRGMAR